MDQTDLTQEILNEIIKLSEKRFSYLKDGSKIDELVDLTTELEEPRAIFLTRLGRSTAGKRTLLVAALESADSLPDAMRWAAEVRSSLTEPETSDLYLFLQIQNVTEDMVARVEADEKFCRKYVLRSSESISDMLARSFLAPVYQKEHVIPSDANQLSNFRDPLVKALATTNNKQEWFNAESQNQWREAFLSGKSGIDITNELARPFDSEDVEIS